MTISSTFDTDLEGWTANNGTQTYFGTGGTPGGYIGGVEGGSGVWTYVAPTAFLGDQESYYGGTLSFDLFQPTTASQFDGDDIILTGNGVTLVLDAGDNPGTDWTSYSVDLELGAGWRVGSQTGPIASESTIRSVLADLTALNIRGEFVSGTTGDASGLDNVVLEEGPVDPGPGTSSIYSSTFDTDIDGWSFIADVQYFYQADTGGNPGGYLEAVDYTVGEVWFYVAPAKFLGDKSAFYGGTLSFDLQQSAISSQFDDNDVLMTGGGITLALDLTHPGTTWTPYSISLGTASDWRIDTEDGAVATEAQIQTVLASLESLHIRGEYITGSDTGGLDNVVMQADTQVTLYQASAPATPLPFLTLEAAISAAETGSAITVDAASIPRETTGDVLIDVNNLAISGVTGYSEGLALLDTAHVLTLGGMAAFDVTGTTGADTVTGNDGANLLRGGDGADDLRGEGADDIVAGNAGADRLRGGTGNDLLFGGTGDDVLAGNSGNDTLSGGNDNDKLYGGDDNDELNGDDGNDTVSGGNGNDLVRGGTGDDTVQGDAGNDTISGNAGADTLFGGDGDDRIFGGTEADELNGEDGNDVVNGGLGGDLLRGGNGDDDLAGTSGNDTLAGNNGNDTLSGGNDADRLIGGTGTDIQSGGDGADVFVFTNATHSLHGTARDTITDFEAGIDTIDLSGFTGTLSFVTAYTGAGNEVRYNDAVGRLYIDIDGNGASEFSVDLGAGAGLGVGDLIL